MKPQPVSDTACPRQCPTCAGVGLIKIEGHSISSVGVPARGVVPVTCIDCDGRGAVSEAKLILIEAERAMWCLCEEAGEPVFVPDGEDEGLRKHHYLCGKCRKVLQIG